MSDSQAQKDNKRIPLYFVAAFVVVAAVNAVMVTLAVKTHSGTVSDKAYQQGVEYNRTIAAAEAAAHLGWQGVLSYQNGVVQLQLQDKEGNAVTPKSVTLTAYRPSQSGKDFTVKMQQGGEGVYQAEVSFPLSGLWELRVQADQFQLKQRIEVK